MQRLSSTFFMIALLFYYIPKLTNKRNKISINIHRITGVISTIAMVVAMFGKFGTPDFIKYIGFVVILLLITITGIAIKKNRKVNSKLHLLLTIAFFVYLFISIVIF